MMKIQDGSLVKLPPEQPKSGEVDFGEAGGVMKARTVRTGELFLLARSTGIQNIRTSLAGEQEKAFVSARPASPNKTRRGAVPSDEPSNSTTGICAVIGTMRGENGVGTTGCLVTTREGAAGLTARVVIDVASRLCLQTENKRSLQGFCSAVQAFGPVLSNSIEAKIIERTGMWCETAKAQEENAEEDNTLLGSRAPSLLSATDGWLGNKNLSTDDSLVLKVVVPWEINQPIDTPWDHPDSTHEVMKAVTQRMVQTVVTAAMATYIENSKNHDTYRIQKHIATLKSTPCAGETALARAEVKEVHTTKGSVLLSLWIEISRNDPLDLILTVTTLVKVKKSSKSDAQSSKSKPSQKSPINPDDSQSI